METAIQQIKNNKSPRVDNIHAEMLKKSYTKIVTSMDNWKMALEYISLHKKGSKEDCNNYLYYQKVVKKTAITIEP